MEPTSLEMRQRSDDWLEPHISLSCNTSSPARYTSLAITFSQPELEFVFCAHQEDSKELSKEMKNAYNRLDRSTYSNPTEVLSTVVHLEWDLNFDTKIISGSATHSMVVIAHQGAEVAKFDSSGIKVTHVEVNSNPVQFTFGESSKALGNCLVVPIPAHLRSVGDEFDVKFYYSTSPNASAAQWLCAKATRSGNYVSIPFSVSSSSCSSHFCSLSAKPSMPEVYFLAKILLVSRQLTLQLSRLLLGLVC
jgi:hypothetical protein